MTRSEKKKKKTLLGEDDDAVERADVRGDGSRKTQVTPLPPLLSEGGGRAAELWCHWWRKRRKEGRKEGRSSETPQGMERPRVCVCVRVCREGGIAGWLKKCENSSSKYYFSTTIIHISILC